MLISECGRSICTFTFQGENIYKCHQFAIFSTAVTLKGLKEMPQISAKVVYLEIMFLAQHRFSKKQKI